MKNSLLEIKIKKRQSTYLATCDEFPHCKGVGTTKQLALSKLADSISLFIARRFKESLKDVFESDNYTRVLIDATNETKAISLAYNLPKKDQLLNRLFLFKAFSAEYETDPFPEDSETETVLNVLSQSAVGAESKLSLQMSDPFLMRNLTDSTDQSDDAYLFGFPINYN